MNSTAIRNRSWWGKVSAGLVGTAIAGPAAGLIAAGMGHVLDREIDGLARTWLRPDALRISRLQRDALRATELSLAGALARAGALSALALDEAWDGCIRRLELPRSDWAEARALFEDGLRADFPLTAVVNQFRRVFHRRFDVHYLLLWSLLEAAEQRGEPTQAQRQLLEDIARRIGLSQVRLHAFAEGRRAFGSGHLAPRASMSVDEARARLKVPPFATAAEIKQAYRREIGRHHPDRLGYLGLSSEQLAEASAQSARIREAYEILRRG